MTDLGLPPDAEGDGVRRERDIGQSCVCNKLVAVAMSLDFLVTDPHGLSADNPL